MRRILILLATAFLCCGTTLSGVTITGVGIDTAAPPGGGSSANIAVEFDCRSFGQTTNATESAAGTLNIKYATPVMCWASSTTVSGTAVNDAGWVPETWFDWNWDDNSLGSVTRGGISVDLGKSVGLVAAHAFKPSTYAETCNGGTNSSHTVTLTVYSVVSGVRESDSATMTVCVENPATTWPNPVAYCDDADCADDSFTNVVNPGTPTNGGNGTALNTILSNCPNRILVEGGVTFTTAALTTVGGSSCLVESYGTGNAKLKFTNASTTSAAISFNATCGGYRFNDVTFAANDTPRWLGSSALHGGCFAIIDSDLSQTAGEEFRDYIVVGGIATLMQEGYFFKMDQNRLSSGTVNTSTFIWGDYFAFVGGSISESGAHILRFPQWHYSVIDAMVFDNTSAVHSGDHLITMRHDCGGTSSCPNNTDTGFATISRSDFRANDTATVPFQFIASGSGGVEQTKAFDVDILRNTFTWDTTAGPREFISFSDTASGGQAKRFRFIQNAADLSLFNSGTSNRFVNIETGPTTTTISDWAFLGNVGWGGSTTRTINLLDDGSVTSGLTIKNNICGEIGSGTCNAFPSTAESSDNRTFMTDYTDGDSGNPSNGIAGWAFTELRITSSNTDPKGQGVVSAYSTDVLDGESIPQSSDYDSGVDDE